MSLKPVKPGSSAIAATTISLQEAKGRTKNWRDLVKTIFKKEDLLPRAVYIPIADLVALAAQYNAVGVRMYFSMRSIEPPNYDNITGLLVPVDHNGKDIIINVPGHGLKDDPSSIYDFTTPCPTECDPSSSLY